MMPRLALAALAAALAAGCHYDPAAQDVIDALGPEEGTPSATHRPGQPCLACHSKYGGAQPAFAVAGTVYALDDTMTKIVPVKNVRVTITDSSTDTHASSTKKACTNSAGNFYITQENWADITYPLAPTAGGKPMTSLVGRDGSCASCHKLPGDDSLDPITGASRDTAGVILVDANAADPMCGGGP